MSPDRTGVSGLEEIPAAFSPSEPVLVMVSVVLADLPVWAARPHPAGDGGNRMMKLVRRSPGLSFIASTSRR
jgi:hypothetical protein